MGRISVRRPGNLIASRQWQTQVVVVWETVGHCNGATQRLPHRYGRYQQYRIKQMMLALEPKLKKKKGEKYFALPEGLDKEWQEKHHAALVEEQRSKIEKKFNKENEKLAAEGSKEMKPKELEQRMEVAKELEAKLKQELKRGKVEPEGKGASVDKYEKDVEKLDVRIANMTTQAEDREGNKEVALGTSKIVSRPFRHFSRVTILTILFRTTLTLV